MWLQCISWMVNHQINILIQSQLRQMTVVARIGIKISKLLQQHRSICKVISNATYIRNLSFILLQKNLFLRWHSSEQWKIQHENGSRANELHIIYASTNNLYIRTINLLVHACEDVRKTPRLVYENYCLPRMTDRYQIYINGLENFVLKLFNSTNIQLS